MAALGTRVTVLHSRMSEGEKYDQYCRIKEGKADIVIGPRSALFVPFDNLGLIVIDEEHENSYKSESPPCYHAREVAIRRAQMAGASVVLGSATPSVESYEAAKNGTYTLLELKNRAKNARKPEVHVVDLREELQQGNRSVFSRILQEKIRQRLSQGEQTMLFLNRRGYAGFVSCRSCGYVIKCSHCDISMTAHKSHQGDVDKLVCHYCGHATYMPKQCPSCGSPYIAAFGLGTQKVEEMLQKIVPKARILRMDGDTTTGKNGHEQVLAPFRRGEADILIGTQMIVKGHDFPNVTLVAALAADLGMYGGDYRCQERTFDLLMQASGRAADQQRDQEQPQIRKPFACQRAGYNGGDISADRNKPRMPQGELAHKANHQVQRCDHDDGVAGGGADALNIGGGGAERIGGEQPCQQGKHQRHAHSVQKIGAFYFFTHCSAPSLTLFRRCSCPGYRRV